MLADNHFEAHRVKELNRPPLLDQVFRVARGRGVVPGDIKLIEDRRNAHRDTSIAGVRTIILIENSVRFYSAYLPMLYAELTNRRRRSWRTGSMPGSGCGG